MNKRPLPSISRPTPLKVGILSIIICCMLFHFVDGAKYSFFTALDERIVDAMFRFRGPEDSTGSVVIVDIDENSLKEYGQWPWPRNVVAELTEKIYQAGSLAAGFDMLFAEKDRTSPASLFNQYRNVLENSISVDNILQAIYKNPDFNHDRLLGNAIAKGTGVVGYMFIFREDFLKKESAPPRPAFKISFDQEIENLGDLRLPSAYRSVVNIPEISTGSSEGFINLFPDSRGMVRKAPLFVQMDKAAYTSLPLEMVRLIKNKPELSLQYNKIDKSQYRSLLGVSVGDSFVRTDDYGQLTINFRGPYNTFLYLPAGDILKDIGTDILRDKYVLIGSSATGIMERVSTPFSARMPGVEVHANVIDNLVQNDAMIWEDYREIGLTYILIAVAGLLIVASLVLLGSLLGLISALAIIYTVLVGNYYVLFLNQQLYGISYILFSLLTVFITVSFFNYFLEGRKRIFIRRAFSQYVSPSVVTELLRNPERLNLSIETREVTVLFCDIRDFTTVSEYTPPAELGSFLNVYFTLMTDIITRNKGMVDKYIGDAIMAVWGSPLDDPHHSENGVRAALEMVESVKLHSAELQLTGQAINIGIGINTGRVSAGNFGSSKRFDYTVLGDNVNLASRIEGLTKYYQSKILISEFTHQALGNEFDCRFVDSVLVKGRNRAVELFEPLTDSAASLNDPGEKEKYRRAIEKYRLGRFEDSRALFLELYGNKPEKLYKIYLERNDRLIKHPPSSEWIAVHDHN